MKIQIAPLNASLFAGDPKSIINNSAWMAWFQSLIDKLTTFPVFANNAAAIAGGLTRGDFYRTGGNPDTLCIVH